MKVLIADDDPIPLRLLEVLLRRWHYEPVLARNGTEAWNILQGEDPPRLAILDWLMPGLDGLEICRRVRVQGQAYYTYIVLLTAKDQKKDVIEGLDAGADDYLTKPFNPHELQVRLRVGQRVLELENTLVSLRAALSERPAYDPLTGLWNRGALQDLLHMELERGRREGIPVGVLLADLDHFRRLNETHGYPAGDAVLREVAVRFRRALRPYDPVGRYGEDDFLVILPGCDGAEVDQIATRLRQAIAEEPVPLGDGELHLAVSMGTAIQPVGEEVDAQDLLQNALERLQLEQARRRATAGAGR